MTAAGQPSPLGPAIRLALRGLRGARGGGEGGGSAPKRRVAVERRGIRLERGRVERFLAVTEGEGIAAFHGADALLPPTATALWENALLLELLAGAEIPFPSGGLIHLGGEVCVVRPLRADGVVRCRVELDRVEPDPRGSRLTLVTRNWNAREQLCCEGKVLLLLRHGGAAAGEGGRGRPRTEEREPAAPWEEVASWRVGADHGRRYARVSGDYNPIHLWPVTARLLGFPRPILHGYCTEAMIAHSLVARSLGGDPTALRRLEIRFRAPLALPASVRLLASRAGAGPLAFRLLADEERRPVAEGTVVGG